MRRTVYLLCVFLLHLGLTSCDIFRSAHFENLENNTNWVNSNNTVYFCKGKNSNEAGLYKIQINGLNEQKLVGGQISTYQLSPDGKKIVFRRFKKKGTGAECGIAMLAQFNEQIFSNKCDDIDWSPDSRSVSYSPNENEIFVFNIQQWKHKEIFKSKDILVGPRWSKSGKILYFNTLHSKRYFAYDLDSKITKEFLSSNGSQKEWSNIVDLSKMHFNQTDNKYQKRVRISPSGKRVLKTNKGSLYFHEIESGIKKQLLENSGNYSPDFGVTGFYDPMWTADEKYAFGIIDNQIVVVEIETARAGILTTGGRHLTYIPGYYPKGRIIDPMYYIFIE